MSMRSIRLCVALVACLAVAGCVGGQRSAATPPATSSQALVSDKIIVSSPTPDAISPGGLLKAAATASPVATSAPGETVVAGTQQGPLSCVDQHLKDIQAGKVLPTGSCQ